MSEERTCPNGHAVGPDAQFCGHCGAAITSTVCERGHELEAGARFCSQCGKPAAAASTVSDAEPIVEEARQPRSGARRRTLLITGAAVVALVALILTVALLNRSQPGPGAGPPSSATSSPENQQVLSCQQDYAWAVDVLIQDPESGYTTIFTEWGSRDGRAQTAVDLYNLYVQNLPAAGRDAAVEVVAEAIAEHCSTATGSSGAVGAPADGQTPEQDPDVDAEIDGCTDLIRSMLVSYAYGELSRQDLLASVQPDYQSSISEVLDSVDKQVSSGALHPNDAATALGSASFAGACYTH